MCWGADLASGEEHVTDDVLVERVRDGDKSAFGVLYSRHVRSLTAYARTCSRSLADADDLVADAFASTYARLAKGAGPERGFVSYMRAAIRNGAISRGPRAAREVLTGDSTILELEDEAAAAAQVASDLLTWPVMERVGAAFARLRPEWQRLLWRIEVDDESSRDIASEMGITANALGSVVHRAREAFKDEYLSLSVGASSCKTFTNRHLAAYVRGSGPEGRTKRVRDHLPRCVHCQYAVLGMASAKLPTRRVLGAVMLGGFTGAGASGAGSVAHGGASSTVSSGGGWFGGPRRWIWVGGALTVCVLALIGVLQRLVSEGSTTQVAGLVTTSTPTLSSGEPPPVPNLAENATAGPSAFPGSAPQSSPDPIDPPSAPAPGVSPGVPVVPVIPSIPPPASSVAPPVVPEAPASSANPPQALPPVTLVPPAAGSYSAEWESPGPDYVAGSPLARLGLVISHSNHVAGQGYRVDLQLPTGVSFVSGSGGCSASGQAVTCIADSSVAAADAVRWRFVFAAAASSPSGPGGLLPLPSVRVTS